MESCCVVQMIITLIKWNTNTSLWCFQIYHSFEEFMRFDHVIETNHTFHIVILNDMDIGYNSLVSLPHDIFSNLRNLNSLHSQIPPFFWIQNDIFYSHNTVVCIDMESNRIAELPVGVFDNNINLHNLHLSSSF